MLAITRPNFELFHTVPDGAVYRLLSEAFAPAMAVVVPLGPNQPYLVKSDGSVEVIRDFYLTLGEMVSAANTTG